MFNVWLRRGLRVGVAMVGVAIGVLFVNAPSTSEALAVSKPYIKEGTATVCIDIEVGRRVYHVCYAPPHPTSEPSEAAGQ